MSIIFSLEYYLTSRKGKKKTEKRDEKSLVKVRTLLGLMCFPKYESCLRPVNESEKERR